MRSRHGRGLTSVSAKIKAKHIQARREKLLRNIAAGDVAAVTKYVAKFGADYDAMNFRKDANDYNSSVPLMTICEILVKPEIENPQPFLDILRVLLLSSVINRSPHDDNELSALQELGRHATPVSQQAFAIMWSCTSVFEKNASRGYFGTPLMIAVTANAVANFELIMADADVNIPGRVVEAARFQNDHTNTALLRAAVYYRPEMFCRMYANIGIQLDLERCLAGMSYFLFRLLNDARIPDRFAIAQKIIESHNFDINAKDEQGRTLLIIAIQNKYPKLIKALLGNSEIDVNAKDADGVTPILHAFEMGDTATAEKLIARDDLRDLRLQDKKGRSAMMPLNKEMSHTYLETLTARKDFDVNTLIDGLTPLLYALTHRRSRIAELIAERKDLQDINAVDELGKTALLVAMQERYEGGYDQRKTCEKIVPLLMSKPGIDVSLPDKSGMTPLLYAVAHCSLNDTHPFIKPLLQRKDLRELNARDSQGRTALYISIANQTKNRAGYGRPDYDFLGVFDSLVKKEGVDINLADNDGVTPLLLAASIGAFGIALNLIRNPNIANVNARDAAGRTALLIAIEHGESYLIAELLANKEIDINAADNNGMTPLLQAVLKGNIEVALTLLARNEIQGLNAAYANGDTVLGLAVHRGYYKLFDALLAKNGVDFNVANKQGTTPLMAAISAGHTSMAMSSISELDTAALNAKNKQGETALFLAVAKHESEVFRALLAIDGVAINAKDNQNNTPLLKALQLGNKKYALTLLERKDVDVTVVDNDGSSCVSVAAYLGFTDILAALLQRIEVNIDLVNQCTKDGRSALMHALERDNIECAKMLLIPGVVNVNVVSKDGMTALKIAAEKNDINMLNLLLDRGAAVDHAYADGNTLLLQGVRTGNRAIVRVALDHGASLTHKNLKGRNALMEAVKSGDSVMLGYLLERMTQHPQAGVDMHELFFMAVKRNARASLGQLLEHVKQTPEMRVDIYEAFIEAVNRNNEVMVDSIYKYGVDLSYICQKTGRTALETALNQKYEAMTAKLLQLEAECKRVVAEPVVVEAIAAKPVRQPSLLSKHFFLSVKEVEPKGEAIEDKQKEEENAVVEGTITLDMSRAFC